MVCNWVTNNCSLALWSSLNILLPSMSSCSRFHYSQVYSVSKVRRTSDSVTLFLFWSYSSSGLIPLPGSNCWCTTLLSFVSGMCLPCNAICGHFDYYSENRHSSARFCWYASIVFNYLMSFASVIISNFSVSILLILPLIQPQRVTWCYSSVHTWIVHLRLCIFPTTSFSPTC